MRKHSPCLPRVYLVLSEQHKRFFSEQASFNSNKKDSPMEYSHLFMAQAMMTLSVSETLLSLFLDPFLPRILIPIHSAWLPLTLNVFGSMSFSKGHLLGWSLDQGNYYLLLSCSCGTPFFHPHCTYQIMCYWLFDCERSGSQLLSLFLVPSTVWTTP